MVSNPSLPFFFFFFLLKTMDIAWQIFLLLPLCVATTMSGWNIVLFCMLFPFPSLPFSFSRHQHHMHSFALFLSPSSLLVKVPHTTLFYSLLVIVLFSNNIDYLVFFFSFISSLTRSALLSLFVYFLLLLFHVRHHVLPSPYSFYFLC
jgi:hypothetical protein